MIHSQSLLLGFNSVVHIRHLQPLGRLVQHPPHTPFAVEEELRFGQLATRRRCLRLDMQVYSLLRWELVVALGCLLQFGECGHLCGAAGWFGLRAEGYLLSAAPAADTREARTHFLGLCRDAVGCWASTDGDEVLAVVLFAEAMLETVLAVAAGAVDTGVLEGVD